MNATCQLLEQYNESEELVRAGDIEAVNRLYNLLELHESYVSEMRKNILSKLRKMKQK